MWSVKGAFGFLGADYAPIIGFRNLRRKKCFTKKVLEVGGRDISVVEATTRVAQPQQGGFEARKLAMDDRKGTNEGEGASALIKYILYM